ncbi:MAG: GNAT family N-acetyltransferase [Pseudolysinimonas sp.]
MIAIRLARLDEREELVELQRRASLANPGDRAALEAHPEAVDTPAEQFLAGQVIVAETEEGVCGFAAYLPRGDGDLELDALFVEPDRWRRGLARALVAYGSELARRSGARTIHVIGNPHAREFYLSVGFESWREASTQFGPATEYVLAVRDVASP